MKIQTYILPAYWASYLINGDDSGLDSDEKKEIHTFLRAEKSPYFFDCGEPYFSRHNDATGLGGDVCEYRVFVKQ